jgi:cytochrome c553/plasmid stability protein
MTPCNGLVRSSLSWSLAALVAIAASVAPADDALFEASIRPVLVDTCFRCHGGERVSGGLRVDSRESLLAGGDSGPAIVAGDPANSLLLQAISRHGDVSAMPPEADKALLPEQVAVFDRWIAAGALWPEVTAAFEVEGHWAFKPVADPAPPPVVDEAWCQTPIDRFIRARQEEAGVAPLPRADRRTLIRRATFDLTGLPPTREEVEAFVADPSPRAFDTVVERLLASTAYGERWARHWLDVVRYADTAGETADYPVPVAWRYRNYCVDAFNRDLPYDEFLREQIAGDILAAKGPAEAYADRVAATGFLAISRRFGFDSEKYHHLTIQDTIDTVGQSIMALSLGCARCHDHKFDPVSARDYYALYGIFESSRYPFPGSEQKQRVRSLAPLEPPGPDARRFRDYEARVASLAGELAALERPVPAATLRSVTDLDGDFELQAPAGGGSYGVLVPPWRYEGPINVTAAAQSPFKNIYSGGRCGVSIAAGAGPYRCTQAVHGMPRDTAPVFLNLDLRLHAPAPAATGRHRLTLTASGAAAIELVVSAESLALVAAGATHDLGPMPAAEWINLQLAIDFAAHEVSGRLGSPGNVREFGPFSLAAEARGPIDGQIDGVEFAALVEPTTAYAAAPLDCDNLALQSTPIPPVSLERPAAIAGPDAKALRARLRELSGYDGDLEMQSAGAPPVAPWNPGPASVVRLDAKAQSPFTNLYAPGRLGLTLPSRAEYDGFGLSLPPLSPDSQGRLHVSFDIRPGKRAGDGAGTWRYSIGHGPGPSPAIEMFFDDAAFVTRDGQTTSPVATLAADRWHQVQLVLDLAKRTYTGLLISEGSSTPFSGPLAATWDGIIDYTFIDSYGHVGGLRPALDIDNFSVSSTPHRPLDVPAEVPAAAAGRVEEIAALKSTLATLEARADTLAAELRRLLAEGPLPMAYAMAEGTPADARIQRRGEPDEPGEEVPRGFVAVLGDAALPATTTGSGRLELAEWLTRPSHPLTARVMVNRIWQHHFGRGLVATPNDFGVRGRPPTHPELLDRLATDFVRGGWSIKAIHRQILASAVWQQETARADAAAATADGRNLHVGFERRRLSAEEIRDAILAVSGRLDRSRGEGHPFPPSYEWGYSQHGPFGAVYDHDRRSLYLMTGRLKRHPFLALFDGADPNASTADRLGTTVPTQALFFLNDPLVHGAAEAWAGRLEGESPDRRHRIEAATLAAVGRVADSADVAAAEQFLTTYAAALREGASDVTEAAADHEALAAWLRTLLAGNEFLHVD